MDKTTLLQLRRNAHKLKPIVIIGMNELTANVQAEIDRALEDHELIKIRVNARDKAHRQEITQQICDQQNASLIQTIGHTIVLYRQSSKDK